MRNTLLYLFLLIGLLVSAQETIREQNLFLRLYSLENKKFTKGYLQSVSDDSLEIEVKDSLVSIPITSIGKVRTKRSLGGNVIIGAILGGSLGFGLIADDPETSQSSVYSGEERIVAVVGGLIFGGAIGAAAVFKKSKVYLVNGNREDWKKFIDSLN